MVFYECIEKLRKVEARSTASLFDASLSEITHSKTKSAMELQQYWLVLKRRWLPAIGVLGVSSALAVFTLTNQKPIYEAEGQLRFTGEDPTASLTGVGGDRGALTPLIADNNPVTTEMAVIRSVPTIEETIRRLNLRNEDGDRLSVNQFLRRLSLANPRGTDLLEVSYRDPDGKVAQEAVNTLMQVYLEKHLRENRVEAQAARQFIEDQLPKANTQVQRAEAALRAFKEQNQVAVLDEESRSMVTSLGDLRRRIAETRSELASADSEAVAFSQQLQMSPQQALTMTALSQSPGVQTALTELQTVESQLATERVRFTDENHRIQSLLERKANLEAILRQRVGEVVGGDGNLGRNLQIGDTRAELVRDLVLAQVRRQGLASELTTLASAQAAYQQRISVLPRLEQEQRELERRLEAANSTYSLLLTRFHEVRVAESQNVGNARILQPAAVADRPIAPRTSSHLAIWAMLGVLAAIGTALLLESRDKSIRTLKQARDLFNLTLLGVIPAHRYTGRVPLRSAEGDSPSEVIVRDLPMSPISECYRMLHANLKFLSSDRALKTIVVTSAVPGEGKTLVAANLAMAIAQNGHRVLLIDADLRCGRQHQVWSVMNESGLSNVIVEQLDPQAIVKSIGLNLDLLTAGVIPPNPAALLDSQRMASLIRQFSAHYDFVVIDTPSVNVAADALTLGKVADGVLLVTRPGVIDVGGATIAKERLEQSNQTVLGQVINSIVPENEPDSYHYFMRPYGEEQSARLPIVPRV